MHVPQDLKFGLRSFAKAPLLLVVALLSLVFNISANTAISSHRSDRAAHAAGKASGAARHVQRCRSALSQHYGLEPDLVSDVSGFPRP
jgi:hypothetical protein